MPTKDGQSLMINKPLQNVVTKTPASDFFPALKREQEGRKMRARRERVNTQHNFASRHPALNNDSIIPREKRFIN